MDRLKELKELIEVCFEAGYLRSQRDINPKSDCIRKKDAEAILARNGLPKVLLSRWVSEGVIEESKGENNSPKHYSLSQITTALATIKFDSLRIF